MARKKGTAAVAEPGTAITLEDLKKRLIARGKSQGSLTYEEISAAFDVLEEIHKLLGRRVKLDQLAKDTLGKSKSGDGVEAVGWWRAGDKDRVAAYCEQDVAILRDVVEHGRAKGYVVVAAQQVTVKWD